MVKSRAARPASLYEAVGGAAALRALARRFVAEVQALPSEQPLRRMFDDDMGEHEQRLFEFLSGWLGGPPLYTARRGLPNLRARHRHLPIGSAERDQWLRCMRRAVAAEIAADAHARLDAAFWAMACSLRNTNDRAAGFGGASPLPGHGGSGNPWGESS